MKLRPSGLIDAVDNLQIQRIEYALVPAHDGLPWVALLLRLSHH